MRKALFAVLAALALTVAPCVAAQQGDQPGCKDHPLFPTRMPGYRISDCKVEDFGSYDFWTKNAKVKVPVEGRFTFITYTYAGPKGQEPSAVAIVRNYEDAFQKIGGTVLADQPNWWANGKIAKNGQEAYFQVERGNGKIWLRIVEKQAMQQHVVADAAAFSNDIRSTGHAAVYGIYFDTGKSTIRPESAQAIGEVAKLLKSDPGLRLYVVGHTDNQGNDEANLRLSQDRAEAVLQALVRDHGIEASRLRARGCGQYAPVASNDTEDGRAKNRRVELVKP